MNKRLVRVAVAVMLIVGGILFFAVRGLEFTSTEGGESSEIHRSEPACTEEDPACPEEESTCTRECDEELMSPEEKAEVEAEAKIEAFDNLTDKWMEPAKTGVTMKDVDAFVKAFREVPKDRQDECVHRALNLIPDENVMLLAGILMDKSVDKEILETIFNDILTRDEDVKMPIMREILKDKTHPCWADAAWILDVPGEK